MFRFWLQFHPLLVLLVLLAIFAMSGAVTHWLQCRSRLSGRFADGALGLPTFVAISTLFALFAAFLLADTMARNNSAQQAVEAEAAALLGLAVASETTPEGGGELRAALSGYATLVVEEEWPLMKEERASPAAGDALVGLLRVVYEMPLRENLSSAVHGDMLLLAQKIVDARADRLATVTTHFQSLSWTALFLLGFLTQFALGMGFVDRPASNRSVMVLFGLAAVVALWLIAIQDNPFRGPFRVSPAGVADVIAFLG